MCKLSDIPAEPPIFYLFCNILLSAEYLVLSAPDNSIKRLAAYRNPLFWIKLSKVLKNTKNNNQGQA